MADQRDEIMALHFLAENKLALACEGWHLACQLAS